MEGEWSATTSVLNYTPDEVFSSRHHYHCRCGNLNHKCIIIIIITTTTIRKSGKNQPASFCSLHLCFSWWSLRVLTPCYSLIQFGTQLCGLGRIRGTNTSFSCYNSVGAVWKTVWKNLLLEPVCVGSARSNAEQTSFSLLAAYRVCVFSVSSGDVEPSSDPYVGTHYTTIRRRNPEAFYLLGYGR
jgi:hypothetical protein